MQFHFGHRRSTGTKPDKGAPLYHHYHLENPDADVMVATWQCPVAAPANVDASWFARNCTVPLANVSFGVEDQHDLASTVFPSLSPTLGLEHVEAGIAANPGGTYAPNSRLMCDIPAPGDEHASGAVPSVRCNWYTWQPTLAEITVYAWECPDGYDVTSTLANPMEDCIGVTKGVQYQLTADHQHQAQTGAGRTSASRFDGLQPGEYTLAGTISPDGEGDMILWQCFGVSGERAHSAATDISLSITGGEHIMCHRFHIPQRSEQTKR